MATNTLRLRLRELLAIREQIGLGERELVRQKIEAVLIDQTVLVKPALALPLCTQVLETQLLALDRDPAVCCDRFEHREPPEVNIVHNPTG